MNKTTQELAKVLKLKNIGKNRKGNTVYYDRVCACHYTLTPNYVYRTTEMGTTYCVNPRNSWGERVPSFTRTLEAGTLARAVLNYRRGR